MGITASNGKVFLCPFNSSHIVVIDSLTFRMTALSLAGKLPAILNPQEKLKWNDVVVTDGKVFFCPCNAPVMMVVDAETLEVQSRVVPFLASETQMERKWAAVTASNGKVYFCPHNSSQLFVVDAATMQAVMHDLPSAAEPGAECKWQGIASSKGKLFFTPFDSRKLLVVDEDNMQMTEYDIPKVVDPGEECKWQGAAVDATTGTVVFCPRNAQHVFLIDPSSDAEVVAQWTMAPRIASELETMFPSGGEP
jgi:outer membrane protein assembly factor BamB